MWGCRRLSLFFVPAIGITLLSACTQPPGTIIRQKELPGGGQVILNDSRVRSISTQRPDISTKPGIVMPTTITCVEPPPSVALAMAQGLATGISVLHYGSGALSNAISENVFQTEERTIAIQALLNASFQNCLDYSNGAITSTFYAIRAANLDNLLVTMTLASESAGNLRSNLGSASTEAEADAEASQSSLADSVEDIQKSAQALGDARRNTTAKKETLVAKQDTLNQATADRIAAEKKKSDALAADPNADTAALQTDIDKKVGAEKNASAAVDAAKADLREAEQQQDDLENAMLSKVEATASSSAAGKDVKGAGGVSGRPTDTAVLTIGEMQRRFLDHTDSGQYITACLVELGLGTTNPVGGNFPNPQQAAAQSPVGQAAPAAPGAATSGATNAAPAPGGAGAANQPPPNPAGLGMSFERNLWMGAGPYLQTRANSGQFGNLDANLFTLMSRSERDSQLAQFCKTNLLEYVQAARKNEQVLSLQRGDNERISATAHMLDVLLRLGEQCEKLTGKDDAETAALRAQCRLRLDKLGALAAQNALPGSAASGGVLVN
jgi:hypothetical protein